MTLEEAGVYSLHISVFDLAGNEKTGRALFFYDDKSVVSLHGSDKIKCTTASKKTNYKWVVMDTNKVKIDWTNRFMNTRHNASHWLYNVLDMAEGAAPIYDELYGNRTNASIPNINGKSISKTKLVLFTIDIVKQQKFGSSKM